MTPITVPLSLAGRRGALACLSLCALLPAFASSAASLALPTLGTVFGAPMRQLQWIVLSYLLVMTTMVVLAGRVGDLIGRRRLLMAALIVFATGSMLCALASSLWLLIAARLVQGLGAAGMLALILTFVGDVVPKARTGSAMGLIGSMTAVGTALGPSLGGLLIAEAGWPSIFQVNLPLAALALLMAWRYLPADRPGTRQPGFDHLGTIVFAAILGSFALAMTIQDGRTALLLLAASGLGAILFVRLEARAPEPLLRISLFRKSSLGAGFLITTLVSAVVMATLVVGPFYLSGALSLTAAQIGLIMATGPLVAAFAGMPGGRLVDRFGAQIVTMGGLATMACGSCGLMLQSSVTAYVGSLAMTTGGYALVQAATSTAVMAGLPNEERGLVSGLLQLSRNLGLVTGASLMGTVYALGSAAPGGPAAGMQLTFAFASALLALAMITAMLQAALR